MSADIRINDIQLPLVAIPTTSKTQSSASMARPSLFDVSNYDGSKSVDLEDGSSISLPSLSDEERKHVINLFAQIPQDKRADIDQASQDMATAVYKTISRATAAPLTDDEEQQNDSDPEGITWAQAATPKTLGPQKTPLTESTSSALTTGATLNSNQAPAGPDVSVASPALTQSINNAAQTYVGAAKPKDFDQTVQAVAYMGVIGLQSQLGDFAHYVQGNIQKQRGMRTDIAELRTSLGDWPDNVLTQKFSWTEYDQYGKAVEFHDVDLTKDQAKAQADKLSDQLQSMSDITQLDQMKLQDMAQKYQEGINTITNVLKFNFDTTKSIISNLRA